MINPTHICPDCGTEAAVQKTTERVGLGLTWHWHRCPTCDLAFYTQTYYISRTLDIRAAEQRYGLPPGKIAAWIALDKVKVVPEPDAVSEGDIAFLAALYQLGRLP